MSKRLINVAHQPGPTCIAFSRDGKLAYTGGSDSLVRIWHTDEGEDQEPDIATEANEGVTTVTAANDYWLSGSEDSEVRRYPTGKNELDGLVTSAVGVAVRSLAVDPRGRRVAVTSDELSVKLIDLEEVTKVTTLSAHKRGVRKVTWHPSGSLLTTSGSDGSIIVWDVSEDEAKVEKTIEGVIPAVADTQSPEFLHDCSAVWHTSGQYFFAASRTHEIVTISRETWSKTFTYTDANATGPTTALALSANGVYLASSCGEEILVWSVQTRRVLWRNTGTPKASTIQIAFSPTQNLLAWTDTDGMLTRWPEPIPAGSPDPVRPIAAAGAQGAAVKRAGTPNLWNDGDVAAGAPGDEEDEYGGEDWIIDDLGGGMEDEPEQPGVGMRPAGDGFVKEMVSITKAQPAFQPGSTPMENKKRYLAYNMVGVIEVTDQDTHHIVNVEFHDRSTRKGYHFTDHFKYDLGCLGERGALFGCPPELDHPAQVIYKPYGTWSTQGDWTYVLPSGQRVLGLAAGGERPMRSLRDPSESGGDAQGHGNVVIATSAGDLTFVSGSGVERIVLGLEGEYVTMVAGEECVLVVHRPGATTIDGSQSLVATLISFEDFEVLQEKPLPIPKGQVLKWVGMTDEGAPAIYDSAGYVHIMINFRRPNRGTWARLLDTNTLERKQGKDESYWAVGLSQDTFMCLILKGRQEHPGFPRPLIQELAVRMPFRNKDPTDAPIEERIARERVHINLARDALGDELTSPDLDKREVELDKSLLKLIQAACKADKAPRVLELTKRLHFTHSIDAARQVAGFYRLIGLQEKIDAIKEWKADSLSPAEEARERRRNLGEEDTAMARPKPFQDFKAPRKVERPGLARSAGVVEHTEFTASNAAARAVRAKAVERSASRSTSPEGKRKRDEEEDFASNGFDGEVKRRALGEVDAVLPLAKPRDNPFARKAGQEPKRNPFARKPEVNKPIQKSESFFNKVEAAELDKGKRECQSCVVDDAIWYLTLLCY
ncbi:WD40 repeat-like protein [Leucogyrophana mollusca]|uniref:WD40 repeat-like protein n=1 Tax=Leucogyrophana mollusca TaxID=85980 RepID=A0ACB8BDI7_9AGAM|nr:WD40 repeat-like protein [Leucogyrophana mollusca]